ncbi:origin recognition complex subunit 4 [Malassezia psittaci]|uniref:Origin recognition complex subunit 4 n=1 Tax=Malassezia psittaci TaxID=1821823 RepID=A0AAF0FBG9_9BASI|nr:origin recognition complex subunit 4 [Malassezia psittaci]
MSAVTLDDLSLDAFNHKHGNRPLLHELTELEMALLITARHLQLRDREPFTWEMCLEELHQFVQRLQRDLNAVSMKSSSSIASANLDALNNRSIMMQVFRNLLRLELFIPESARLSLALPSGVATRTGAATNAYGVWPSATVIPEFLPVFSNVSGRAVLESARSPNRVEPLHSSLIQWAESTGV